MSEPVARIAKASSSPKCCLIVQQVGYEGPGRIGEALDALGWETVTVRPFAGDPIPTEPPDDCHALVVMGGPQSAYEEDRWPFLSDEKRLLRAAIARDFPTIGVCLGAQLLADAAGARVYRGSREEAGWLSAELTAAASDDPLFGLLPPRFAPFQWHNDTFDLPDGATPLASSSLYPRQAFRLGRSVYGLQFHVEVNRAILDDWLPRMSPEVQAQDHERHLEEIRPHAERFLQAFFTRI